MKRRRFRRLVRRELDPPERRTERERAELVRRVDQAARASGDAVRQVSVRLSHSRQRVTIANSEGLLASDERLELQLSAAVTAQRDGLLQVGRRVRGGQAGLELLTEPRTPNSSAVKPPRWPCGCSTPAAPAGCR